MSPSSSYPQIQLTLNQEFTIQTIKMSLPSMSRVQLEEYLIEIIKQRFAYENAFKGELKRRL